jgi:hypothetical protein
MQMQGGQLKWNDFVLAPGGCYPAAGSLLLQDRHPVQGKGPAEGKLVACTLVDHGQ